MSEIDLDRLRALRWRAEVLINTLTSDLKPFRHERRENGFVRTPNSLSDPDDVNVTTTCSCLMSLALAGKLSEFYAERGMITKIFKNLVAAPWMSSGLAENNPFTTTLVLRTFGFLTESKRISRTFGDADVKEWELRLSISDFRSLAAKLGSHADSISKFIFELLPLDLQKSLKTYSSSLQQKEIDERILSELEKLIRTTHIYEERRFENVKLKDGTKKLLHQPHYGYSVAQLNRRLFHDCYSSDTRPLRKLSLREIAESISQQASQFQINDYPVAAAVVYWFVDGIDRSAINLPPAQWNHLSTWAASEFRRQRSLVVAKHAAMMDPVAMAMAACLCARIRRISNRNTRDNRGTNNTHQAKLPTIVELEHSIIELFEQQTDSGIWPKYFPLFHYQEAGSNFCFTFELLEAVLAEFGHEHNTLINYEIFVKGVECAVTWCEHNRLGFPRLKDGAAQSFTGWNSGGFFETLQKGQPESWATAVVHMFLWELADVLSRHIQKRLLEKYHAKWPGDKSVKINGFLDVTLWIEGEHKSLTKTITKTIIASFQNKNASDLRKDKMEDEPRSALLFGPPGTSKTELAKAIAAELNWPLVVIDPSHFLQNSFQSIYIEAEKIFKDAMDLSGAVILFDEMDALVQKRDAKTALDTESKFLTTYMLPKLAELHDRGRVVFFMATNFQANFDDAIKRAGRFDFLFCMGPPTLESKRETIHAFYRTKSNSQTQRAGKRIWEFCQQNHWLGQQLELYTFGEFKSFITAFGSPTNIGDRLHGIRLNNFLQKVKADSQSVNLKLDDLKPIMRKYKKKTVLGLDEIEIDIKAIEKNGVDVSKPVIRYILDRKQSRRQCPKLKDEDL